MAGKGKIENLTPIKPGEVRNPKGKNQWSDKNELINSLAKKYNVSPKSFKSILDRMIVSLALSTREELQAIMKDPNLTLFEKNAIQAYTGEEGHDVLVNDLKLIYGKNISLDVTTNGKDIAIPQLVFAPTPLTDKDLDEIKRLQSGNAREEDSTDTGISETESGL